MIWLVVDDELMEDVSGFGRGDDGLQIGVVVKHLSNGDVFLIQG